MYVTIFVDTTEGVSCFSSNTVGDSARNCGSTSTNYIPCLEGWVYIRIVISNFGTINRVPQS